LYEIEPQRGISSARNRALAATCAPLVAFVDDDETVSPGWLTHLERALNDFEADVVFGAVISALPPDAPAWSISNPCFRASRLKTGQKVSTGATNNVLMRRAALGDPLQQFDLAYSLTGGEDTDYFCRLHRGGRTLVWCAEATVTETIPADRLTVRWVCLRAFRGGQSYYRAIVRFQPPTKKVTWALTKPLQLVGCSLGATLLLPFSTSHSLRAVMKASSAAGQLTSLLGRRLHYQEYLGRSEGAVRSDPEYAAEQ